MPFSCLATAAFEGAYAVLAKMSQTGSQDCDWITAAQMVDGLRFAEPTPGPLTLVTRFSWDIWPRTARAERR